MFRSKNYYDDGSFLYFVGEAVSFVMGVLGVILGISIVIAAVVVVLSYVFAGPECRAKGEKMNLDVTWEFSTGCMIRLHNQWLPWSEVVPVEKDGKVTFTTKLNSK